MGISSFKYIRKGHIGGVLENSGYLLPDGHLTFQNWWRNGWEKWTWSWQPPSKNGTNLMQWIFFAFFKVVANFKCIFLSHFSTNFEMFGAYPAAFKLNFPKHTNFSLSDGYQSSYGHVSRDPCFFYSPCIFHLVTISVKP